VKKRGFTLIELLVVIAIIAILAAILFPVFAQAKLSAKKAADLSNIKQMGLGVVMYMGDFDDLGPGNTVGTTTGNGSIYYGENLPLGFLDPQFDGLAIWTRSMDTYLKNKDMVQSPVDASPTGAGWSWTGKAECGKTSYFLNAAVSAASQTQIPEPANLIMFRSHRMSHRMPFMMPHVYGSAGNLAFATWAGNSRDPNDGMDNTFGQGQNVTWADGHAKYKRSGTITWYELGSTNSNPKDVFPEGGYYYIDFPWRGKSSF
jgi:prepilin-type N-terminal cleavage/methylation domain-containing protein/prepilin-type processing-associated H-X9-DG protein